MPFVLDNSKSIRFQEGVKAGFEKATEQRNTAFVKYLVLHTNHSIEEISRLVGVSTSFAENIKSKLK